jgi:hypothetical protein
MDKGAWLLLLLVVLPSDWFWGDQSPFCLVAGVDAQHIIFVGTAGYL